MKTVTEKRCALTVDPRKKEHCRRSVNGCLKLYPAAVTCLHLLVIYCGMRQDGEIFVLSGMDIFSILNHTSA